VCAGISFSFPSFTLSPNFFSLHFLPPPPFSSGHHRSGLATTKQCRRPLDADPVNLPIWSFRSVFFFLLFFPVRASGFLLRSFLVVLFVLVLRNFPAEIFCLFLRKVYVLECYQLLELQLVWYKLRSKKIETVFVGLFSVFVFCPLNF